MSSRRLVVRTQRSAQNRRSSSCRLLSFFGTAAKSDSPSEARPNRATSSRAARGPVAGSAWVPTGPSFHTSRPPVPSPLGRRPARRAAARRPRSAHHSRRWPSARLKIPPRARSRPGYRIAAPLRHRVPRDYRATGLPSPRARPGYRGLSGRYPGRTVPPTLSVRLDTRARYAPPRPPRRRLSQDASPGPAHRDGPRPDSTGHTTTHISMVPSTYRTTTNVAHSTSYHTQYASTGYMGCYVQGHLYRDGVPTSLHIWNPSGKVCARVFSRSPINGHEPLNTVSAPSQ